MLFEICLGIFINLFPFSLRQLEFLKATLVRDNLRLLTSVHLHVMRNLLVDLKVLFVDLVELLLTSHSQMLDILDFLLIELLRLLGIHFI